MGATGGSLESVSLDGRAFPVAADAEVQRKLGGMENEVQANGDGSTRTIQTRVPWSLDGLVVEVDDSRGDHEYLQALSNSGNYFPIALTYSSNIVYQGQGQIVGEMQTSSQSATATVSLMGPQSLTKQ